MFISMNAQAMDSVMMTKMQERICWEEYENSDLAPSKHDDRLGYLLFWLYGKEDKAYEEHRAYLRAQAEFNVNNLSEDERQALSDFLSAVCPTPVPTAEVEDEVEDTDYAEKHMEQKGRVRMKRRSARQHKAYVRGGAWTRNHEMHVAHAENVCQKASVIKNNHRKDCEEQMEMYANALREAEYEKEVNAAWEKYEDEKYFLERYQYGYSLYDPMIYFGSIDGEEKDWAEHKAFIEDEQYCSPTDEEKKARYDFMAGEPEELPDIDETVFAKEYQAQKGTVNAKRRYARKQKLYERNGGLTTNRSKHIRRVLNNVHLGYSGVWPADVFHPTVRSGINTSRRRANKIAIMDGLQELCDVAA